MNTDDPGDTTALLARVSAGERGAADDLLDLLTRELREMAHHRMSRQRSGHTLQTTALIHEAWIRIFGGSASAIESRMHFLKVASSAMRSVLVDHARRRGSDKRGGLRQRVELPDDLSVEDKPRSQILDLDAAVDKLAAVDQEQARIAELRCFGGLSSADVAVVMGVSKRTVERGWTAAKVYLSRELDS